MQDLSDVNELIFISILIHQTTQQHNKMLYYTT